MDMMIYNTPLEIKKRKSILFANLVQNSKELGYKIPWKKFNSVKEPLLYAKAQLGSFLLFADLSYKNEEIYYGLLLSLPLGECQIMPEEFEESETIFELGFNKNQKKGLEKLSYISDLLQEFNLNG